MASTRRPPTLKDVAAAAGVSKALASLVLRDAPGPSAETRARVQAVAEQLGYRANRTASLLARRRTRLLGVTMIVRSGFHAELVEAIQEAAKEAGYSVVLSTVTPSEPERSAIEALLEFRCEALILLGPDLDVDELAHLAAALPLVVVGRRIPAAGLDVVRTADDVGLGLVVDHLVGLGHRRIAYVGPAEGDIARDRRRGYVAAMRRHGLADAVQAVRSRPSEAGGRAAAAVLLESSQSTQWPTAVTAFNDRCAVGLLDGLDAAGVPVPGGMSVVGYDDSSVASLRRIDLTSVSQEARAQAMLAVAAAVERLDAGRTAAREHVLTPRLVVRGSSGQARVDRR